MHSSNLVVPGLEGAFRCPACSMQFRSDALLHKHKARFCVGSTCDPDHLQLRRGFRSISPPRHYSPADRKPENRKLGSKRNIPIASKGIKQLNKSDTQKEVANLETDRTALSEWEDEDKPRSNDGEIFPSGISGGKGTSYSDDILPHTPDKNLVYDKPYTDSELVNKKIGQLKQFKDKKSWKRDMNDLEERLLLDKIQEYERSSPRTYRNKAVQLPLSKHRDIRGLQMEYERLRELENSVIKQPVRMVSSKAGRLSPYSRDSNSSMSIHIIDDDYRRPNQDHIQNLAQEHGRQMHYLQSRNKDLEKQREDILKKLEGLGRRSIIVPAQDNTAELLRELREQENRNRQALEELRKQLYDMNNNQKVNVMDIEIISRNIGRSIEQIVKLEKCMQQLEEEVNAAVKKYNIVNPFKTSENTVLRKVNHLLTEKVEKNADKSETTVSTSQNQGTCIDKVTETIESDRSELTEEKDLKKDDGARTGAEKERFEKIMDTWKKKKPNLEKLIKEEWERKKVLSPCREIERPAPQAPAPVTLPPPPPPEQKKQFVLPVYYGRKSLVAEISAIRQAYLLNGGNDPEVLANMAQMLAEAQAIEDQENMKPEKKSPREKPNNNMEIVKMMEMENERLIRELRLLQDQKVHKPDRSDKEDELEREMRRLQRDHLEKMYSLQKEMDDLKLMLMMERNKPGPMPPSTVIHQAPPNQVNLPRETTPWLFQKPYVEVEAMAPYDQYAGFVIFYDFIHNMDPTVQACRVVVGLHSSSAVMGEPTVLPTVYAEPATRDGYNYHSSNAVLGAKQPVPNCPPEPDLGLVAELQISGGPGSEHDRHSLITRAWTKIPLFDNSGRIIAGRFKIPMRNVPIKPFLHVSQVQRCPKYGDVELYYRIVNMRDAEIHSMQQISASNHHQYSHPVWNTEPPEIPVYTPKLNIPPPPTGTPKRRSPSVPRAEPRLPSIQRGRGSASPPQIMSLQDMMLGFQVDRVKNADPGEGKVRLTAYYASTGKIVQSSTSPVTCSTTAVRSNFKFGYHVFGQQEASFQEVDYQGDMVLIARLYLKKRHSDAFDEFAMPEQGAQEASLYDDETLTAWAAIPLVLLDDAIPLKKRRVYNPNTMAINQGTHTMPLFLPPVPEPNQIPFGDQPYTRDWERYGKSTLRVYVFQGQPRPGSLTPSDMSETEEEDTLPEFAWLPLERKTPPKDPYLLGDGFDVYVDGCRYLPDSVTFTKIAGRILDRRYDVHGKDINTSVKLDSDVYNPVYEDKTEYRETSIPPTATLLLKVYTVDNFYKTLTVVGYASLNIFIETGTERQPTVDRPMQVSLNEGAHQLRLYGQGPNGVDPFTENCLRDSGVRIIPCASVLVRIVKVARGAGGKALESSKVPQADWLRMGLWQPRPKYTDRVYYSSKCMPTKGETRLFHNMMKRTRRSIREVIALVASAKESFLRSDKNMEEYIRNQLTKAPDAKPLDQDLNFICKYSPKNGIKVAVDSAVNLPWSNFTHAHMCLNPPAAFYLGAPHATYDKLTFTELLDVRSTNTSPAWKDGFKHFPRRSYHRFVCMIIHLQEIQVTVAKDNYKYGLLEQAWTAVQIFTDKYCNTQAYQLPLFAGSPSQTILKQLAREPCKEWMERNIRHSGIHLLEGSSIFVRVADARRDDELQSDIAQNKLVEVNTDYIPVGLEESYSRERPGKPLESLVPIGKTPDQFVDNLKTKFKSLVYKLYEEGNVGK